MLNDFVFHPRLDTYKFTLTLDGYLFLDEFKPEGDESDEEETIQKEEDEMDKDEVNKSKVKVVHVPIDGWCKKTCLSIDGVKSHQMCI